MYMKDFLLFAINGGGWALKPILEKGAVDKLGHYYFTFLRYLISGIIAIPFLIQHYYFNGFPKKYKKNSKLFLKDVVIWGGIVSVIAMIAIMANYYLLEKYDASFVTPIVEALILLMNAGLSVWLLGETVTTDMIIGIFFIIVGIVFIYREKMKIFK